MSPVIDEMMLSILLSHVADHGSVLNMQYYADSVMSGMCVVLCVCVCVCFVVCVYVSVCVCVVCVRGVR